MKTIIFIIFLLPVFCGKAYAEEHLEIGRMRLTFRSDSEDKKFIAYIKKDLSRRLARLKDFYGVLPAENYKIYLLKNKERFDNFSKENLPQWSRAIAYVKENIIILKINTAEDVIESSKTLVHELSHLILYSRFNEKRIPVWLNEGIAEYTAGKELSISEKTVIANALWGNTLLPLSAIDSLLLFDAVKARQAYLESLLAVKFFIGKFGTAALYQVLENMDSSGDINKAFLQAVGYDFIDFELDWYKELDDKYLWMVILNMESLLWITITALSIIVFVAVKLRNKKKMEDWDAEDDY